METEVACLNDTTVKAVAAAAAIDLPESTRIMLWTGIAVYLFAMLLIGCWASRRVKDMKDFLVAGRRLPLWMATATLLATWFGAGSSMGVVAYVYENGPHAVIADPFAASLSLILAGIFVVGLLRRMKCLTVTDIVEKRYGRGAGAYAALWMVPVYIGWLGAQMMGMGAILQMLTGMERIHGTLIAAAVVLAYTMLGGMWAVTLTDVVQVTLIICGLVLIVPGAMSEVGGLGALLENVPKEELTLGIVAGESPVYYFGSWIIMGLGCMVGQDLIQRSLASKNEKVAISSSVMAGFFYLAIGFVPITIGLAARIIFAKHGVSLAGDLENQVLPRMAVILLGNLSPIVLTLFLCALISAIMSSADSSLLAGSSLLTNNVVKVIRPDLSDRALLLITRFATLALTLVAMVLAIHVKSIYELMINSWASQLVIVFIPVVTALHLRKASKNCAWASMLAGTAVWLLYMFIGACGVVTPEMRGEENFFVTLMRGDDFQEILTCGAVYGFLAALAAFFCVYFGEALVRTRKRQLKKELRKAAAKEQSEEAA